MKKLFVSAFIVLNFMSMARVHLPLNYGFFSDLYKPVDSYLRVFSIFQDWFMFAPNPSRTNYELTGEVEFTDGTKEIYQFPKTSHLNLAEKYVYGERYRKLISEGIRKDDNRFMWTDTAKFVLRKVGEDHFNKIPKRVHLVRHWEDVPLLSQGFRKHGTHPDQMQSYRFFTHEVL